MKRRISGYATAENVAAVATDEPQMAAKPPQATTVATPRPPRRWPIIELAALKSSRLTPDTDTSAPISMNIGITPKV